MVGLENIKTNLLKKIIYYIQNPYSGEYLHTIITGPPGVGKTEFAKIYSDIFVRLNILKSHKFIEVKRDDFIAEYLGQTAIKTRKLLDSGLDGVIFLDEAYSMGNQENRDSFSKEAIDMINQYLSEQKDKLMFIIAGYEKEINSCFFDYNKGLKRRFQTSYSIESYSCTELAEIFKRKIKKEGYDISNIKEDALNKFFKDRHKSFTYFGGDIERLINELKHVHSFRIFTDNEDNKSLILADIETSFSNIFKIEDEVTYNLSMYI
jgi:SpoVK/Ycf46/Vps4 family AAA+-type ATPase